MTELLARLRPDVTPAMGLQAYEFLDDPRQCRTDTENAFYRDEIRNPDLEYPLIDRRKLGHAIRSLQVIMDGSESITDDDMSDAVYSSAAYRMAEAYHLIELDRLDRVSRDSFGTEKHRLHSERAQEANEQLYGRPDDDLSSMVVNEIYARAQEKPLHKSVQKILNQLENGTRISLKNGTRPRIGKLVRSEGERLPQNISEILDELKNVLEQKFPDVFETVKSYWDEIVVPRTSMEYNTTRAFNREDMKVIFEAIHAIYDPNNESGIKIVFEQGSTQLAWDTPSMSIKIGTERKTIDDVDEMIGKVIHEYGHALKAVNGLKSSFPLLGTGMYTLSSEGKTVDYLTSEEGFLSLCEMAVRGGSFSWEPEHISRYLADICSYQGMDFRQAYEIVWRARVVLAAKPGEEATEEMIAAHKRQARISVRRLRRGTPTDHAYPGSVVTYNKDLAYLPGKMTILQYLSEHGTGREVIDELFEGKFAPMDEQQLRIKRKTEALQEV